MCFERKGWTAVSSGWTEESLVETGAYVFIDICFLDSRHPYFFIADDLKFL